MRCSTTTYPGPVQDGLPTLEQIWWRIRMSRYGPDSFEKLREGCSQDQIVGSRRVAIYLVEDHLVRAHRARRERGSQRLTAFDIVDGQFMAVGCTTSFAIRFMTPWYPKRAALLHQYTVTDCERDRIPNDTWVFTGPGCRSGEVPSDSGASGRPDEIFPRYDVMIRFKRNRSRGRPTSTTAVKVNIKTRARRNLGIITMFFDKAHNDGHLA
jgi:hypothetical protein